jgi:hypothetical protein
VAIVTITGLLALRVIEPPAPFDAAGKLSVNVPLCAPDDAFGVGTVFDEAHAETMPLSAAKVTRTYIRPQAAKRTWDLRFTACSRRRRKTAQHRVQRLAVMFYA